MPLFGKKKNEKTTMSGGGYPTQSQPGGYPTQPSAAPPGYGYPTQQQMYGPPQGQAPPPYSAQPQPHMQQAPQQYYYQQPQPAIVHGQFDAGARFGAGASANIPPPPPGVAPNAAQMAQVQGQNVVMTQRPDNFFTGGSDGGYTVW